MAYDYSDDLIFAQEEIAEYGRVVDFIPPGVLVDANDPMGGNTTPAPITRIAAFVELSSQSLGAYINAQAGLWKECEQVLLVAADGVNDFTTFPLIKDGAKQWKRHIAQEFKPGDTALLYFIGLVR